MMNHIGEAKGYANITKKMQELQLERAKTTVAGKEFSIHHGVFHPDITPDVKKFLNEEVLKIVQHEVALKNASFEFLEVGCGAGYTSVLVAMASEKCKVWATDISEAAVANTVENAKTHGVAHRVHAVVADVFDHEEIIGRKFDMIYWNMPSEGHRSDSNVELPTIMKSFIDPGNLGFQQYLSKAQHFLKSKGRVFVAFSFNFGSKEVFESVVSQIGWRFVIRSNKTFLIEKEEREEEFDVNIIEFYKNKFSIACEAMADFTKTSEGR
ncbi:Release factor glutamine methyltransferase [Exaiptasia diaphana]|nr:Release factor glutamine methyltransferase [Exaiptasia diaphana]